MKRFFIITQLLLLAGCSTLINEQELGLSLTASYGQSAHVSAEKSPHVIGEKVVHFDGQNIRIASFDSLVHYDLIDDYALRTKLEYFSATQGYSVSESHELIIIDVETQSAQKVAQLKGPVLFSPTKIADDKIFVQYLDNSIQCLDHESYDIIWERSFPDVVSNYYAGQFKPLSDQKHLYFSIPGGLFLCLDAENGQTIWSYNSQIADKTSTLNIADFLSPKSLLMTSNGDILLHNSDGYLHCLSKETGLLRWIELVDSSFKTYEHEGLVYTYASDNTIVCYDEKLSDPIWTFDLSRKKLQDFIVSNQGELYVLSNNQLFIIDEKGEIQASYRHEQRNPHLISTLSRDKIFLANEDKNVFTLLKK